MKIKHALPNNLTVFFPLNPLLPFLPIKIATIIYSSLNDYPFFNIKFFKLFTNVSRDPIAILIPFLGM